MKKKKLTSQNLSLNDPAIAKERKRLQAKLIAMVKEKLGETIEITV